MPRLLALAVLAVALSACSMTDDDSGLRTGEVAALAAPAGGGFVLYSLRKGAVAGDSLRADGSVVIAADTTTAWDIGFRGTEIVLNGGTSGPGAGVGAVVDVPYERVTGGRLDDVAYRRDGESACPGGPPRAVCAGAASELFTVSDDGSEVSPVPGRTLVLRLGDNSGFAKLEVTGYTGDPAGGTYAFRYTANVLGSSFVPDAEE